MPRAIYYVYYPLVYKITQSTKKWKLVAEEIIYLNQDYTPYATSKNRIDSIKNETVQFMLEGIIKAPDGIGKFTVSKDSIQLSLNGKTMSFKYHLHNAKLTMQHDSKESNYILRSKLYLE